MEFKNVSVILLLLLCIILFINFKLIENKKELIDEVTQVYNDISFYRGIVQENFEGGTYNGFDCYKIGDNFKCNTQGFQWLPGTDYKLINK